MSITVRRIVPVLVMAAAAFSPFVGAAGAQEGEKELTPNAWFMTGNLYFQQKVYEKSENAYRHAVQGDTTNAQYRSRWANALCEVGKVKLAEAATLPDPAKRGQEIRGLATIYQEAQAQFARAIALDPDKMTREAGDNRQHYWVDMYKQAQTLFNNKQFEDALEHYRLLTILDPGDPQGLFQVGYTLDKLGKSREGVDKANESKALALKRIADLGDCSQFKSRASQVDCSKRIKDYQVVVGNADRFTKARNVAIAEQAFSEFEALPADKIEARRTALLDAESHYRLGLEQDPKLVNARFNLGNVYFALAKTYEEPKPDTTQARKYYRLAYATFDQIAAADSVSKQTRVDASFNSASASFAAGDWKKSLATYKSYIDLNCKDPDAFLQVALCYQELKQNADRTPYYMTYNAMSAKAEKVDLTEARTTLTNRFAGSDELKAFTEVGEPDEVKNFRAANETYEVQTLIWWSKGLVRHYIEAKQQAEVKFAPCGGAK